METLFQKFHTRRSSLIRNLSKKWKRSTPNVETTVREEVTEEEQSEDEQKENVEEEEEDEEEDGVEVKDEEDTCPICLLEMVEGESLTECVNCQNKLHHHCIAICKY